MGLSASVKIPVMLSVDTHVAIKQDISLVLF